MTTNNNRTLVHAAAAAVLLGTLAFLFFKTEQGGFERRYEVLQRLANLRDIDMRWDREAEGLRGEPRVTLPPVDRAAQAARIVRELKAAAARIGSPALDAAVPEIERGAAAKAESMKQVRERHAAVLAAREALEASGATLSRTLELARNKEPRAAGRLDDARRELHVARSALHLLAVERASEPAVPEVALAALVELPATADAALPAQGEAFVRAARAYAAALRAESGGHANLAANLVGLRIDGTAQRLSTEVAEALGTQERYRTYLFAYAGALLIFLGMLAARVIATQAQLRAANEGLERRVEERTAELSRAMQRLKESEAQLVQTEKMSSLGQMVAGVAHEINTPLAYVKNSVDNARARLPELRDAVAQSERLLGLLQSDAPDAGDLQEAFAALSARLEQLRSHHVMEDLETLGKDGLHGIEQISELVDNLRNFSRLDRSRVASFNVNDGVNATMLIARTQLRKISVEKNLGNVPLITCSPSQVNQVLLNLITNAAQAMDKGSGRITITTHAMGSDSVVIEVEDNGRGIAPDVLPKIFDPFFTTKEIGTGTGLGLSIAYKIVEQHGGRIDVRSTPGAGTAFTIVLPIVPPASLHDEPSAEGAAA